MKSFACGQVVPNCEAKWVCATEEELFAEIAQHAEKAHGLTNIPPELVEQVRENIVEVDE